VLREESEEQAKRMLLPLFLLIQNLLVTWLLCKHYHYIATHSHAVRIRVALWENPTSEDAGIRTVYIGFFRYAVEGIFQEGRQLL
jgi:hypothetical protein